MARAGLNTHEVTPISMSNLQQLLPAPKPWAQVRMPVSQIGCRGPEELVISCRGLGSILDLSSPEQMKEKTPGRVRCSA